MRIKPFPNYSSTGVPWIPSLPVHWDLTRLKYALATIQSGGTPDSSNESYWSNNEDGIPWVSIGDMTKADVVTQTEKRLTSLGQASKKIPLLPSGTLLYSIYASLGKVAVLGRPATTNQAILGIVPDARKLEKRYLSYWLNHFERYMGLFASSSTQQNLNAEKVRNFSIASPTLEEQTQIARFLDYETAKIDALIEKQQQLIALLKEKRQAVISHAVTKGLNPDAPMRDSGVEWLGEVPVHWTVPRIGYVACVFNGSTPSRDVPQYWVDEGVPWMSSGKVNEDIVREPTSWISKRALAECSIKLAPKGSVLVGMIGQGKTRATCAILGIESTINQNMAALVTGKRLDSRYLYLAVTAAYDDLRLLGRGANPPALNCDILRAYRIPLPPLEEQRTIAGQTQKMLDSIESSMALATRQGELLRERRTTLISAAVTGKIDLRGWKAPESELEVEVA